MPGFFIGRVKSLKYAVKGFFLLLTTENSIITQTAISLVFVGMGFYFKIDRVDWALQFLAMGLVLAIESLNTAVEKVCDFVHPDYHQKIGFIKDIASGAVTFAVLTAFLIGMLIYLPYFL
ncbi:diacylglycerol kinase family protein [Algoriphagus sp. H41]|uniref:Diacylglycerol kinase family protein n=1 Tax=Algoriphagus oliviformis TaxID=2811231 RepID=A0ABS3C102_9BACT|nr:diacylglycerol kinase family protein [Algoriphagus oliviformis]MBN7810618.1 diacylglycerol kinase family protein [Algoriphagus oliviformis]